MQWEKDKRQKRGARGDDRNIQYLVFYVNEMAGWHTNVSVNGSKAFLLLQGNPLGWHGLIQSAAGWMTHSGEACRIVEETILAAGGRSVLVLQPFKKREGGWGRRHTRPPALMMGVAFSVFKWRCYFNKIKETTLIKASTPLLNLQFSLSPLSFSLFHHFHVRSDHLHISLVI